MVEQFGRAKRLMLSSKSNLGGFLLSWWFAANADAPASFVDLDHAVTEQALTRSHKYFCDLPWGSRRGMCKANQTACDLAAFAKRNFCAAPHGG